MSERELLIGLTFQPSAIREHEGSGCQGLPLRAGICPSRLLRGGSGGGGGGWDGLTEQPGVACCCPHQPSSTLMQERVAPPADGPGRLDHFRLGCPYFGESQYRSATFTNSQKRSKTLTAPELTKACIGARWYDVV